MSDIDDTEVDNVNEEQVDEVLTLPKTFFIAGVKYHDYQKAGGISAGSDLQLFAEPLNKFDRYAIKIKWNGIFLGYVPRPINIELSAIKETGRKVSAKLYHYNPHALTHEMFEVKVTEAAPSPTLSAGAETQTKNTKQK